MMQLKSLRCPNCGAMVEPVDGLDTFYCGHCGYRIVMDELSKDTLHAKVRMEEVRSRERMAGEKLAHRRHIFDTFFHPKRPELTKEQKKGAVILIIFGVVFYTLLMGIFFMMAKSEQEENARQAERLERTLEEIEADLEAGDYDSALFKANTLHYDAHESDHTRQTWDNIREGIIRTIEERKKNETPN